MCSIPFCSGVSVFLATFPQFCVGICRRCRYGVVTALNKCERARGALAYGHELNRSRAKKVRAGVPTGRARVCARRVAAPVRSPSEVDAKRPGKIWCNFGGKLVQCLGQLCSRRGDEKWCTAGAKELVHFSGVGAFFLKSRRRLSTAFAIGPTNRECSAICEKISTIMHRSGS